MQNGTRFSMVSPMPGFTDRVMTRIAERERVQARQRALIGTAVLVLTAIVLLTIVLLVIASWIATLASLPNVVLTGVIVSVDSLSYLLTPINALWVAATTLFQNIGSPQMLAFAISVLVLTLFWVRVVSGSFQSSPRTVSMGG
jgi:hypothetical protein